MAYVGLQLAASFSPLRMGSRPMRSDGAPGCEPNVWRRTIDVAQQLASSGACSLIGSTLCVTSSRSYDLERRTEFARRPGYLLVVAAALR
jgi:hypothetical protein